MKRLNEKELRKEYIRLLKYERTESGVFGLILFSLIFLVVLIFTSGFYKLLAIIPLIFLLLTIDSISTINKKIKENE